MTFIDLDTVPAFEPAAGCKLQTPHGERLMLSRVEMKEGAEIPLHRHHHEQAGVVLEGQLQLTIGEETKVLTPGQMYIIPGNVPHRAIALNGRVVVMDVFSPIREDYVAKSNASLMTS
jgi:quercetin dioxygenase-like cupin family protein